MRIIASPLAVVASLASRANSPCLAGEGSLELGRGDLNRNQQVDALQRPSGALLPKPGNKELLPLQTKTELGETLIRRVRAGDYTESELWCLSRLGARKLFHGPVNQVLPPGTAARWVEALLALKSAAPPLLDAVAAIARRTGNVTIDVSPATLELARARIRQAPEPARLLAILEGEEAADLSSLGRIFGEELPPGLVLETAAS